MINKIEKKEEIVEVVETKELKNTLINLKIYNDHIEKISNAAGGIVEKFLIIGKELNEIKKDKSYLIDGYTDVYEFSKLKFGFGVTSTKNFINVYLKFGRNDYSGELKKDYKGFSFSQLVELLPVSEDELNKYKPEQTVEQIREVKKASQLSDQNEKYLKEFNSMTERVKSILIEKMNLEGLSSEITVDASRTCFTDKINFTFLNLKYEYKFSLCVGYDYKLSFSFTNAGNYCYPSMYTREDSFLAFINKLKSEVDGFVKVRKKEFKEKEKKKKEKIKEKEDMKNCTLKNSKERLEFAQNDANWTLVCDVAELDLQIYKFNICPDFIKIVFCGKLDGVKKITNDYLGTKTLFYSDYTRVADYLKEIKY